MRKTFTILCFFSVIFLGIFCHDLAAQRGNTLNLRDFNHDLQNYNSKLQIITNNGAQLCQFNVAIADNDEKRSYGLMNLKNLPTHSAMLFLLDNEQVVTMWMKDTLIALDMIFINKNNAIVSIKTDAQPMSLKRISSEEKADKVLEINAGLVKKCGIKVGQKIIIKTANENF